MRSCTGRSIALAGPKSAQRKFPAVAEQENPVAPIPRIECADVPFRVSDELDEQLVRLEARPDVFQSHRSDGRSELRDFAAQFGFERVDALLQNCNSLQSLLSQSIGPVRAEVVEQAFVAALQFGAGQGAHSDHGRFQIAIPQRDGHRGLALQHGLPLIEAVADGRIGILAQTAAPVVDFVEEAALAAGHGLKGERAGGGKLIAGPSLEGQEQRNRVLQIREHGGFVAFRPHGEHVRQSAIGNIEAAAIKRLGGAIIAGFVVNGGQALQVPRQVRMVVALRFANDVDGLLQGLFGLRIFMRRLMDQAEIAEHRGIERMLRAQAFGGDIGGVLQGVARAAARSPRLRCASDRPSSALV